MKSVLISMRPKWCGLVLSGQKENEIRKTKPDTDEPFKCFIYCTKASKKNQYVVSHMVYNTDELYRLPTGEIKYGDSIELFGDWSGQYDENNFLNGKVIGEFVCDRIYHIKNLDTKFTIDNDEKLTNNIALASCLDYVDMKKYLGNKDGYAWHITDLVIYDKPKDLSEFKRIGFMTEEQWLYNLYPNTHCHYDAWAKKFEIERPPQSWCYASEVS